MSASRHKRAEPCAEDGCTSRRFYTGEDGYTYCDQGHRQTDRGTIVVGDPGELQNLGRRSRRQDSDGESTATRTSTFSGADALEHYLVCIQLVLRKQLRWLIDIQKLPEELEALVKDLWSIRLQKLRNRVAYDSETDTEGFSSQVFSSQSESESRSASRSSRRSRQEKPREGIPYLLDTLSLCYIGTLLLHLPLTVADFQTWTDDGRLSFYRASKDIPLDMRERLPRAYAPLFEPQDILQPEAFQQGVLDLLTLFSADFGMAVPSINTPLIMYRWMRDLVLPIEVFAGTQRLAKLLSVKVIYDIAKPSTRIVFRYPEAQLMALLVVTTKLLFPLDGRGFKTRAANDLSAVFFDWAEWRKIHETQETTLRKRDGVTFGEAFRYSEMDCMRASDEELDAYLSWCEKNLTSDELRERGQAGREADFRRALFDIFPLQASSQHQKGKQPQSQGTEGGHTPPRDHPAVQPRPTIKNAPEDMPFVGNLYRRFRTVEELSSPACVLYEKAATLACVSLKSMVHAIFWTERKLQQFDEHIRKTEGEA